MVQIKKDFVAMILYKTAPYYNGCHFSRVKEFLLLKNINFFFSGGDMRWRAKVVEHDRWCSRRSKDYKNKDNKWCSRRGRNIDSSKH